MYTLKVLSEKDFDKLPYKHAKTSLGLANAKTGVAFVRDTGYNDITKATISHELDEMVNKVSPHEEDGIRYKNLGSMLGGAGTGILANMLPGKIGNFAQKFSPAISAGAGALLNKDNRLQGALQGFTGGGLGSSVGTGISQGIEGLTKAGGTFGKAMSGFGEGAKSGFNQYMGAIPGMGGFGTDNPTGVLSKYFGGSGSGQRTPTTTAKPTISASGGSSGPGMMGTAMMQGAQRSAGGPGVIPGIAPVVENAATGPSILQNIAKNDAAQETMMDKFKGGLAKGAAAGGIGLIGDMFAPKVEVPDLAGYGADLQAKLQSGELGDPIAKEAGMKELLGTLGRPLGQVPMNAFDLGDEYNTKAMTDALLEQQRMWKGLQPGVDYSNNPEFMKQQQDIIKRFADERTMQRDQMQYEYLQQQMQQKYQYMMKALNVDEVQMTQYIQLAQLGVEQLMMEYGLSIEEARQFKELFRGMGETVGDAIGGGQGTNINDVLMTLAQNQGGTP